VTARGEARPVRRKAPPRPTPLACPSCRHLLSPYALEEEAAKYVRRSPRTLERLRVSGGGPAFQQSEPGGLVTYAYMDLDAWMASIRKHSTSDVTEDRAATATH
jgi:helix-turn-helix protein